MPLNWLMEVFKWQLAIKPLIRLPIKKAASGILAGISFGFVTPHAVGDYFARIWSISHHDRKKAFGPILAARSMQMLPTFIFGTYALFQISLASSAALSYNFNQNTLLISTVAFIILGFMLLTFIRYGSRINAISKLFELLKHISIGDYFKLLALSFIRYAIFTFQFLLLLSVFDLGLSWHEKFNGIAFIFLLKSVLPTFNFINDLGVREFGAVVYFDFYEVNAAPIISASLILWTINIALPAVMGLFSLYKLKLEQS